MGWILFDLIILPIHVKTTLHLVPATQTSTLLCIFSLVKLMNLERYSSMKVNSEKDFLPFGITLF